MLTAATQDQNTMEDIQSTQESPSQTHPSSSGLNSGDLEVDECMVDVPEDLEKNDVKDGSAAHDDEMEKEWRRIAVEGTLSTPWDSLRPTLKSLLVRNVAQYLSNTPTKYRTTRTNASNPHQPEGRQIAPASSLDSFAASPPSSAYRDSDMDTPSTAGGLVIPPPGPKPTGASSLTNGAGHLPGFDPEAAIGGKVLKSYMTPDESWSNLRVILQTIDDFEIDLPNDSASTSSTPSAAPFTVQRLAELVVEPLKYYKSVGKFFRALEKVLAVTSTYDPNPYKGLAPAPAGVNGMIKDGDAGEPSRPPSRASISAPSTPLFSPIPFLVRDGAIDAQGNKINGDVLSLGSPHALGGGPVDQLAHGTPSASDTLANEPYMGRVDELDAGPLLGEPLINSSSTTGGLGESGIMTPHALADRPLPISSTTDVSSLQVDTTPTSPQAQGSRRVSSMPRSGSVGSLTDRFRSAEVLDPSSDAGLMQGESERGESNQPPSKAQKKES